MPFVQKIVSLYERNSDLIFTLSYIFRYLDSILFLKFQLFITFKKNGVNYTTSFKVEFTGNATTVTSF